MNWTCHICGRERPDSCISVLTKPLLLDGENVGKQNIRYCNDNPDCPEIAKEFDFMRKGE